MDIQRRGPVPILFPSDGGCEKKGTEDLPTFEREVGGDGKITCSKCRDCEACDGRRNHLVDEKRLKCAVCGENPGPCASF